MSQLKFKRILLKLSGEALMGTQGYGIDPVVCDRMAEIMVRAVAAGAEVAVVVGGGNIFRGVSLAAKGMDRVTGDYMGMLATVMNGIALHAAIEGKGQSARLMSAIPMTSICEPYSRAKAFHHLKKNRVLIFASGTGNPFFTTDTAATLRAAELSCDLVIKATQVDGIYSDDPKKNKDATRYETVSYQEVLSKDLKVMDATAIALARDTNLPVMVCAMEDMLNIKDLLQGQGHYTLVTA